MPVEPFVTLLDRWRQADGMFARGRVLTEAVRLLRNLTPDERRTMARTLADRGAPELARQLEGSFGGAMEAEQVRAIADQLLSMDDAELGALVEGLRDPDQRRRLATDAVDRAFAFDAGDGDVPGSPSVPSPGTLDDGGPPPPPGAPGHAAHIPTGELETAAAEARSTLDAQRSRLQELADADDGLDVEDLTRGGIELGSTELGAAGLGGVALGSADLGAADLLDVGLGPAADDTGTSDIPPTPGHRGTPDTSGTADGDGAGAPDGDAHAPVVEDRPDGEDGDAAVATGPRSTTMPVAVGSSADAGRDLGTQARDAIDPVEHVRTTLLDRLGGADQALVRLQVLADREVEALDAAAALQVLDAFPDGWQRRRAGLRLVSAGVLQDVPTDELVRRFARVGDATFVVGGLIDAGHLDADSLDGLLPDATVARLRHRQEH